MSPLANCRQACLLGKGQITERAVIKKAVGSYGMAPRLPSGSPMHLHTQSHTGGGGGWEEAYRRVK